MSDRNASTKHLSDYLKIKVKLIKATEKNKQKAANVFNRFPKGSSWSNLRSNRRILMHGIFSSFEYGNKQHGANTRILIILLEYYF